MRKIKIISDVQFAGKEEEKEYVLEQFDFVKDYGADIQIITDNLFNVIPEESKHESAKHRIEFEGPDVFEYEPEFLEELKDSEVILAHYSAVNEKLMKAIPNLKMIGVMRSGFENVDIEAANTRDIIVSNSPGRVGEPVADYALALMLAFNRRISRHDMYHSKKYIRDVSIVPPLMSEMTIGIVGLGIIGRQVAERLSGFGCNLITYDPYIDEKVAAEMGVKSVSLNELMEKSDCITIHAKLTEETKEMIGKEEISLMKPTAFIVNTSRSRLIDENALVEALEKDKIRGAALDVYNSEPLPESSPFFKLDNVLLSPHIAGTAGNWTALTIKAMKEEVKNYLSGKELKYQVNKNQVNK